MPLKIIAGVEITFRYAVGFYFVFSMLEVNILKCDEMFMETKEESRSVFRQSLSKWFLKINGVESQLLKSARIHLCHVWKHFAYGSSLPEGGGHSL